MIGFQHKYELPVVRSRCPIDGFTKRQYAKDLIRELNRDNPGVKQRMFTAILNGNIQGWRQEFLMSDDSIYLYFLKDACWCPVP